MATSKVTRFFVVGGVLILATLLLMAWQPWAPSESKPLQSGGSQSPPRVASAPRVETDDNGLTRERVIGDDAVASPQGCEVQVQCYAYGSRDPLAAIEVFLWPSSDSGSVARGSTDDAGQASFRNLTPGTYHFSVRDPDRQWVVYESVPDRESAVAVTGTHLIQCSFKEAMLAYVKFIGDDLCLVHTSRGPQGYVFAAELESGSIAAADESGWGPDGRLLPVASCPAPTEYKYYYLQSNDAAEKDPTQELVVYTKSHGEGRVRVPLRACRQGLEPTIVDVSAWPSLASHKITVRVMDMQGSPADIGNIRFASSTPVRWPIEARANCETFLPAGIAYAIRIGDFPVTWSVDGDLNIVQASPQVIERSFALKWPTTNIIIAKMTRDGMEMGERLANLYISGEFDRRGRGAKNYPIMGGRLPTGAYPVGKMRFVVRQDNRRWDVFVNVASGATELHIDLRGPGH